MSGLSYDRLITLTVPKKTQPLTIYHSILADNCAHHTVYQSGDTTRFCSQYTKIHFHGVTCERNLNIFMTFWTKPNRTATNGEGDRRLLVFGGEMTSVVNPQRCLATGIRTNRRQNKSQSAWINQKRNSAPSSIQAINRTLLRLAQFISEEAQRTQSVRPHDLDTATGGLRPTYYISHKKADIMSNIQRTDGRPV